MFNLSDCTSLKGFRFPRSVIGYAVWAYHRFALSLRDVEDLLASRGIKVCYETIRDWVARFGSQIGAKIRKARPKPSDRWHLDEVVVMIKGVKHWLWRAVDDKLPAMRPISSALAHTIPLAIGLHSLGSGFSLPTNIDNEAILPSSPMTACKSASDINSMS